MVLVAVPAAGLALLSLAAFFGGWVWWLDVAANFRAQYVVVLLVLGVVLLLGKWRRIGYGVIAVTVVNLIVVLPLFVGSPGEPNLDAPTARIMSFNLLSTNESYSDVISYIESADPDLVLLHEASRPWEIAMEAASLDYEVIRPRADNLIFGTLVLVRGENVEGVSFGFARGQPRAVSVEFVPNGWPNPLHVLSSHPLAPTDSERAGLRDAQIGFAADWADGREGLLVVVGDLNATPWSAPFRSLLNAGDLRNSQAGFGLQPSFPASSSVLLRVPIDHLLFGEGLVVTERRLGPSLGSDHFPLIVDLQVGS